MLVIAIPGSWRYLRFIPLRYLGGFIPMVLITAPICGFGGAWLATRKQRPSLKNRSRKYNYSWTLVCGIVAGLLTIRVDLAFGYYDFIPLSLSLLSLLLLLIFCISGLLTGKITREPRMGWISGITTLIIFTVFLLIRHPSGLLDLLTSLVEIVLAGVFCGLISVGGAWFATRKRSSWRVLLFAK